MSLHSYRPLLLGKIALSVFCLSLLQGPTGAPGNAGSNGPTVRLLAAERPQQHMTSCRQPFSFWLFATACRVQQNKITLLQFYKTARDKIMEDFIDA